MGWFARKMDAPHDDAELLDWDEAVPDEPTKHSTDPMLRRLINGATILLIVVLLAASAHGWLGPLGAAWMALFPPPPIQGR